MRKASSRKLRKLDCTVIAYAECHESVTPKLQRRAETRGRRHGEGFWLHIRRTSTNYSESKCKAVEIGLPPPVESKTTKTIDLPRDTAIWFCSVARSRRNLGGQDLGVTTEICVFKKFVYPNRRTRKQMSIETAVKQYLAGKAPRDDFEWENQMIAKNLPLDRNAHWTIASPNLRRGRVPSKRSSGKPKSMDLHGSVRGSRHQSSDAGCGKQVLSA